MIESDARTYPHLIGNSVLEIEPFVGEAHQQSFVDRGSHSVDILQRDLIEHHPIQLLPCPVTSTMQMRSHLRHSRESCQNRVSDSGEGGHGDSTRGTMTYAITLSYHNINHETSYRIQQSQSFNILH